MINLENIDIIDSKKIGYYFINQIKENNEYKITKSKINYKHKDAYPHMFKEVYKCSDDNECNENFLDYQKTIETYVKNVDLLNDTFNEFTYMKNKNITKGNIRIDLPQDLGKFRLEETIRCTYDPIYFIDNYYYIISPTYGKSIISMYIKQEGLLRSMIENDRVVTLASRQCGKSTSYCMYACHTVCFKENQNILLLANKLSTAKGILARIKFAFELLPKWLKPGVKTWNKESVEFTNGCTITAFAASSDGARSEAANVLIIDEMAFIPANVVEELWQSAYPTISSSNNSKVILVSTPFGTGNMFYELYSAAITQQDNDNVIEKWTPYRIDWWDVPNRDEVWKEKQLVAFNYNMKRFNQEFGNCVHGDTIVKLRDKKTGKEFESTLTKIYNKLKMK